jgi:phage terminase large subunit-like protein
MGPTDGDQRATEQHDFRTLTAHLSPDLRDQLIASLDLDELIAVDGDWASWAHDGQLPPGDGWRTWVIMGGRGFGKTRAGTEWVLGAIAAAPAPLRIALVGATIDEARRVMVEGESGLLALGSDMVARWMPTRRLLRFVGGSEAVLFSGASPAALRGPQHHLAWCDELAKWARAGETWDMLQLGLRLGERPRALVTTTPQPGPVLKRILAANDTVLSGGPTRANPHLAAGFVESMQAQYAGTRLARQELDGEMLPDVAGALWSVALLERCRVGAVLQGVSTSEHSSEVYPERLACQPVEGLDTNGILGFPFASSPSTARRAGAQDKLHPLDEVERPIGAIMIRTVIGVDPPSGDGTCGIIACGVDADGIAYVLADHSVTGVSPEVWARAVAAAAAVHGAALVVAESNQGGAMVAAVLRAADARLPVRCVHAAVGKSDRAVPVATAFEAGKVRLCGRFPELEAQLCGMIAGGGYAGPGRSPDRADAMVWALAELLAGAGEARVRAM